MKGFFKIALGVLFLLTTRIVMADDRDHRDDRDHHDDHMGARVIVVPVRHYHHHHHRPAPRSGINLNIGIGDHPDDHR
jgi:hypothetical protein